jgi:signal transduction histidine kinase
MRISSKLLATYLAVSTLGIVCLGVHDLLSFEEYFRASTRADLEGRSMALAGSVSDALQRGDRQRVQLLTQWNGLQEGVTVRVISPKGKLIASSQPASDRLLPDWSAVPGVLAAMEGSPVFGTAQGIFAGGERLYHARALRSRGKPIAVLRISVPLAHFYHQLRLRWQTLLLAIAGTFGLCALASLALARSFAAPIRAMRDFAVRTGNGRFGERLEVRRGDEIGELATELSLMGKRLASQETERKAFLANIAHELRTPVTNVMVTIEALANGAADEPELRERLLTCSRDEMVRLNKLIEELMELGRLEAGGIALQRQRVELSYLVGKAVRALSCRTEARRVQVLCSVDDVEVEVDPDRICQVLLNLIDNAIKHSGPETVVAVRSRAERGHLVLQVIDEGQGIAREHLPRIFEQFYMADPARQGSGAGLGLAIAKRIVEAHGGEIHAESEVGVGTCFTIRLPLTERAPQPGRESAVLEHAL